MKSRDPFKKLRGQIARLPETSEKLSHGAPTFWGGKKTFVSFHDNHYSDGKTIWVKSTIDAQADLVESDPSVFFVPPYVGVSGWVGVRVDIDIDWDLVAEVVETGYRLVAPKRAIKLLDGDG